MKRVLKYGTGDEIPDGALYLTTVVEIIEDAGEYGNRRERLVWHYFLVKEPKK